MPVRKIAAPPINTRNKELRKILDRIKKSNPNLKPAKKDQKQVLHDKVIGNFNPCRHRNRGKNEDRVKNGTTSVEVVRKDH
ncbi:hypothetical protein FWH30_02850 [Microgenomates group bacterium]|nr:hypothetical protein [Microgenomates group bacterium]